MREAEDTIETEWVYSRSPENLAALMALVVADLSESQRENLMNLIFQRAVDFKSLDSADPGTAQRVCHHSVPCSELIAREPELLPQIRSEVAPCSLAWTAG